MRRQARSGSLSIGPPALGTSLLVFAGIQGAVLMVAATASATDAAVYGAAARIAAFGAVPFAIAATVLPPFLIRYHTRGEKEMVQTLMRVSATATGFLAAVVAAVLWIAGGDLLRPAVRV